MEDVVAVIAIRVIVVARITIAAIVEGVIECVSLKRIMHSSYIVDA